MPPDFARDQPCYAFAEGPAGFKGGLSAANDMTITGALNRTGERKSTRYHLPEIAGL